MLSEIKLIDENGNASVNKQNKVDIAIKRFKEFEPKKGYYLAFSGGKDSCVIKALADMAGVKYKAHYQVTTIDPPDLVYFIREHHKDVEWHHPERTFMQEMVRRGFPMRQSRWCCEYLKEGVGDGIVVIGIRAAESKSRAKRKMIAACTKDKNKWYLSPIIDWTDGDVWEFIKKNNIPYCKLYDEGWKRIGCLACPMARPEQRRKELDRYPGFEKTYRIYFDKLYKNKKEAGKTSVDRWNDGQEMFEWWMTGKGYAKEVEGQQCFRFDQ